MRIGVIVGLATVLGLSLYFNNNFCTEIASLKEDKQCLYELANSKATAVMQLEGALAEKSWCLRQRDDLIEEQHQTITSYEIDLGELTGELSYWKNATRSTLIEGAAVSGYRQFQSLVELQEWLENDPTSEHKAIPNRYDCDDFAIDLVINTLRDGYWTGLAIKDNHMFNWVIIGSDIFRIEARTDGVESWLKVD